MEEYDFSNIPNELISKLFNILDNLDINSILSLCTTNSINEDICSSSYDDYWKHRFNTIFQESDLVDEHGNILDRDPKFTFPYIHYNSVHEYNIYNNTNFNSWYEIIHYINNEIKNMNDYLIIDAPSFDDDDEEDENADNTYNNTLYKLIIKNIQRSSLELLYYLLSYFTPKDNEYIYNSLFKSAIGSKLYIFELLYSLYPIRFDKSIIISTLHNKSEDILSYIYNKSDKEVRALIFVLSCQFSYYQVAEQILQKEEFYDDTYETALMYTIALTDKESVEISIKIIDTMIGLGFPLEYMMVKACTYKNTEIIKYIHSLGVPYNNKYLSDAIKSQEGMKRMYDVFNLFADNGVYPNTSNARDAIDRDSTELLKLITNFGYKLNDEDLHYAIHNRKEKSVIYMLNQGVIPTNISVNNILNNQFLRFNLSVTFRLLKYIPSLSRSDINSILQVNPQVYGYIAGKNYAINNNDDVPINISRLYAVCKSLSLSDNKILFKYFDYAIKNNLIYNRDIFYQAVVNEDINIMNYIYNMEDGSNVELYEDMMKIALSNKYYNSILYLSKITDADYRKFIVDNLNSDRPDFRFVTFLIENFGDLSQEDKDNILINAYDNGDIGIINFILDRGANVYAIPKIVEKYEKYYGQKIPNNMGGYMLSNLDKFVREVPYSDIEVNIKMEDAINNNDMNAITEFIRNGVYPNEGTVQLAKDLGYTRLANFMKYYVK
ncbi:Ankyrin-repeat protein with F-box domain [Orpheovirus IHUMI-LCC2]|uniref:Ankyrin-repeat protein with F-box domain n=1 Tax=Orpheovirus IHUMI-LCC2 TaxID=2023057 RepID=A0A2I2L4R1_9VIRU|nr:Ankyrin-repeat protein with F-box domain [Orpheovirus IHUMI-LCC2]SNW62545.1 Ankyrin-repeat protein with F-box domain [Orpheovirus IHUMI-LCC2]